MLINKTGVVKAIAIFFTVFLTATAHAQWNIVQEFLAPRTTSCGGLGSTTLTCTIGPFATATSGCLSTSCQAIVANHPSTLMFGMGGDYESGTQAVLTSVSDCVTLTSGNCATSLNTWVIQSNCSAYVTANSNTFMADCATVDPSSPGGVVGGALYITAVRSSDGGESLGFTWNLGFIELNNPGGAHIDSVASDSDDTISTTHVMTATTVTGTDAIIQFVDGDPASVSSPYTLNTDAGHQGLEYALNITSGAAPTQTGSLSNPMAGNAVAWTYGSAAASGINVSGPVLKGPTAQ